MNADDILLIMVAGVFGLVFGSFATAVSYRLPRKIPFTTGRSKCPVCEHTLSARDLVPVLSWIAQGCRCRYCKAPIPARYPLMELLMACGFIIVLFAFGFSVVGFLGCVLVFVTLVIFQIIINRKTY